MRAVLQLLQDWVLRPEGPDFLAVWALVLLPMAGWACSVSCWSVWKAYRTQKRLARAESKWLLRQESLRKQKLLFELALRSACWQQTPSGDWVKHAAATTWN